MTIYGDSVPLPASLQGKKLPKIHYNGEDDYLKDGIKLKLESVGFKEFPYERLVTLGTLFTYSPKKGQVYSFNGILTKGIASQELVVEYKGKSIKNSLHYELRLVLINGEDGIEVEDMEVVKLYSGDEGFGTSQIGN